MSSSVRVFAPAKINLFLHAGDRRADGYHALQSLVVFARDIGDRLAFRASGALTLSLDGPHAGGLAAGGENLVLKAARALDPDGHADIALTKNLPVASGIGGGSTDAAAALRGLRQFWNLDVRDELLFEIAARLGSDVPVCLTGAPAWMEGRGEIVTGVVAIPAMPAVLVNPGIEVATARVFANLKARRGTAMTLPSGFADARALLAFLADTGNDLEAPACALEPVIREVLGALEDCSGAALTRMSGSGATCFALFHGAAEARAAAAGLKAKHPGWWVEAGETGPAPQ